MLRPDEVSRNAIAVYDRIAMRFDVHVKSSAHNAYLERPEMLSLLPDAQGLHVLDAGCGSGAYAEILVAQGAEVTALDASAEMVAIAQTKLNGKAAVHQHDLRLPADFLESDSFDIVLCPLVRASQRPSVFRRAIDCLLLDPNRAFILQRCGGSSRSTEETGAFIWMLAMKFRYRNWQVVLRWR